MVEFLKRALCWVSLGIVHWSGDRGIGMYGDANSCERCGADRYGLVVLHDKEAPKPALDPRITARLKALNQAAAEQPLARYPYCIEGRLSCGSQTCGCLDTPHYRARWQSARATAIVKEGEQ